MSTTVISGTVTLNPIGSVDTSSASSGVVMFNLTLPDLTSYGPIIQFEYVQYTGDNQVPALAQGFLPLENAVSSNGISNQYTIAIPSADNEYDPAETIHVKVRAFVGGASTILVTEWSNARDIHNPPAQPGTPLAYIVPGEYGTYYYGDLLYVQVPNTTAYDLDTVQFIVSYSYLDHNQQYQWIVSELLTGTLAEVLNVITLPEIVLPTDVSVGSSVYVAVNAVFPYSATVNGTAQEFYSVSEISDTVQAQEGGIEPPVLDPIVIPTDYFIYNEPANTRSQTIELNWLPPHSSLIPVFTVDSYEVAVSNNGVLVTTIPLAGTVITYQYTVPAEYLYPAVSTSSEFSFVVKAIFSSGGSLDSNAETVNTFMYSEIPANLTVDWAVDTSVEGQYDMLVSFNNANFTGFGTPLFYRVDIYDDSDTKVYSEEVTYTAALGHTYIVYLNNIVTTPTGTAIVQLVTQDTNPLTVGGTYEPRDGAPATANYIATGIPVILNVERNQYNSELSFNVISGNPLDLVGRFVIFNGVSQQQDTEPFETRDLTSYDYTVSHVSLPNNTIEYTFVFADIFFPDDTIPAHMAVVVSNDAGIGFARVPEFD